MKDDQSNITGGKRPIGRKLLPAVAFLMAASGLAMPMQAQMILEEVLVVAQKRTQKPAGSACRGVGIFWRRPGNLGYQGCIRPEQHCPRA